MERKVFLFKIMVVILAIWFVLIGCPVVTESKKDDKKESSDDGDKDKTISLWPKRLGGTIFDYGCSVTRDTSNNIIVIGVVNGNVDLNGDGDSSDGGAESSTGYGGRDIFISKFNSSGGHLWSKRLGGLNNYDFGNSITTDSSNNIVVTGEVTGDADLNGDGDFNDVGESSTGYGSADIFISKFDSSGTYLWSKRLGGTTGDRGYGITTDSSNNIIVTGSVTGNTDLNGDGDSTDGGAESSTGYGGQDVFICKFDSSGTLLWSERLGGLSLDVGKSIATDSSNNIIVTGYVTGNADLNGDGDSTDGGAETTGYGIFDIFISKFNSSGTFLWSKRLGGSVINEGSSITTDSSSNIIVTGYVMDDADLNGDGDSTDGGAESSTGYADRDIFISKFNSSGTFLWSKRLGGITIDYGYGVTTDSSSNVLVTGTVSFNADLNGDGDSTDGGAESSTGYGGQDIFISKFDSSGGFLWSKRLGGTSQDAGQGIIIDTSNNIIIIGNITNNVDLNGDGDSTDGTVETIGYGDEDIFIIKFSN